jgi:hypothetical protein
MSTRKGSSPPTPPRPVRHMAAVKRARERAACEFCAGSNVWGHCRGFGCKRYHRFLMTELGRARKKGARDDQ